MMINGENIIFVGVREERRVSELKMENVAEIEIKKKNVNTANKTANTFA